jgi:tetratricopeptide (TPR) repeat protein
MSLTAVAQKKKRHKPAVKVDTRRIELARSQRVSLLKSESLARSARDAWGRNQYEQTIALYEQALRRDPKNHLLLIDLARAYGLRYRLEEAAQVLDRVVRLYPRNAKVRSMVARSYSMISRPAQAIEHFEKAQQLNPQHADAATDLIELAALYEREHRLEDARLAIDRALTVLPDRAEAVYRQALLRIRQQEVDVGRAQLQQLATRNDVSAQIRSDAWYEIGKLFDREGEFDAAMHAFQSAKTLLGLQAETFRKEREFLRRRHAAMLEQLTAEHWRRWHKAGETIDRRRIALLTGHPRSGTTLLEQVLDGHSQLISADEYLVMGEMVFRPLAAAEPNHIPTPNGLDAIAADRISELRNDYWRKTEALLGQGVGDRLLLDKNPSLSYLLPVICRVFPEIKVLFALRDPRDVVVSCFMQRMPINGISSCYLTLEDTAAKYVDVMRYWLQIRPQLCCAWQEVKYEDTVADLPAQARRTLEFFGLPWEESVVNFHTRSQSKVVRSPTYLDVTQPVYSHAIGRWKNYAKYMEPVLGTLEPYVKAFGY